MPYRSHASLSSANGSVGKQDERRVSSSSVEKITASVALSPLSRHEPGLPVPATHSTPSLASVRRKKKTRIDGSAKSKLHEYWDRFRRRISSGTEPSSSSAFDDSTGDSSGYGRTRSVREDPDAVLDEVVVDREWGEEPRTSSTTHSDHGASPEKSGGSNHLGGTNTDHDSVAVHAEGFWGSCTPLVWIRWRIWPGLVGFFYTRFLDEKSEEHYNKENWFLRKNLALWSALFYVLNWTLATAFLEKPTILPDIIFYYCITPVLTFPLIIMVVYDWPRDRPLLYQTSLGAATWSWGCYQLVSIRLCGFYQTHTPAIYTCPNKDFLSTFYYTSALQTIALFGLKSHRFAAFLGMLTFVAVACGVLVPIRHQFARYVVNFVSFQAFLLYVHYMRENVERKLYTLRDQLKVQYRATQKAQVNERKAADSKRRLTSYVFHEVRVPLNTALLAVQNMEASDMVAKGQEIEFKALEGSLNMMSKVLNDVLDFNRMDSGRFESVLKPYAFHKVMRSLMIPLRLATDSRGLQFITDLDKSIDDAARTALYDSMELPEHEIAKRMSLDEDGIVVGDETRLRQIVTNLASNACKFTPTGGRLMVTTRLLRPGRAPQSDAGSVTEVQRNSPSRPQTPVNGNGKTPETMTEKDEDISGPYQLSASYLSQHNDMHSKPAPPLDFIVVRIEVTDTGCGIRRRDMIQSKLFSPFNQTEMGRLQGGKGTGLGLALVRQIVKLSGGRLGVTSKVNQGSTFWVELPLGVGAKALPGLQMVETPDVTGGHLDFNLAPLPQVPPAESTSSALTSRNVQALESQARTRSTTALHSIMEQGGMVELSSKRDDNSLVLTRTIGDPHTGTDPLSSGPQEEASPTRVNHALPSLPPPQQQVGPNGRPNYLELPAPRDFSLERGFVASSSAPAPTPSSCSSTLGSQAGNGVLPSPGFEHGIKVLVVDDDPLTRRLMSRMLTRLGCKVSTAENGEIALEMILGMGARVTPSSEETGSTGLSAEGSVTGRNSTGPEEYKYAAIFLDNQMPTMSGLETVAKLRELGRTDFVVGVTGNALLTDQQEYLDAGVDHVLTKPVFEKSIRGMLILAEERKRGTPAAEIADPAARTSTS